MQKEFEGFELLNDIREGKIKKGTKFKVKDSNEIFIYNGKDIINLKSGNSIINYYLFTTLLHLVFIVLQEDKNKEILTKKEKQYLRKFIKPFKNKIEWIEKVRIYEPDKEYIQILLNTDEEINLPCFQNEEKYKNMKLNKRYEIKELGL